MTELQRRRTRPLPDPELVRVEEAPVAPQSHPEAPWWELAGGVLGADGLVTMPKFAIDDRAYELAYSVPERTLPYSAPGHSCSYLWCSTCNGGA
ncbi:hypothetical protein [Streptomyces sp. NPDC008125]|uniref:hypothetical protein n=1 Tax=Streptomyces sp. NPDC008125 TaxID=3364811 RepID=UPI0036EA0D7D